MPAVVGVLSIVWIVMKSDNGYRMDKKDLDDNFKIGVHLEIDFSNDNDTKYHYHYLDLIKINIRSAGFRYSKR